MKSRRDHESVTKELVKVVCDGKYVHDHMLEDLPFDADLLDINHLKKFGHLRETYIKDNVTGGFSIIDHYIETANDTYNSTYLTSTIHPDIFKKKEFLDDKEIFHKDLTISIREFCENQYDSQTVFEDISAHVTAIAENIIKDLTVAELFLFSMEDHYMNIIDDEVVMEMIYTADSSTEAATMIIEIYLVVYRALHSKFKVDIAV